ncbi:hypothetical protein [Arenimonas sp.]|uniref:hypothetical protein n=1 Tax=Arenimonas sp. TaxID=1872635 RepID=UPI0035B11D75
MHKSLALFLLTLSLAPTAGARDAEGNLMNARVQLAAAKAPGDLVSDAYLVKMMDGALQADDPALDPGLRKDLSETRDELQARVDAGMNDDPVLLATLSNCFGYSVTREDCGQVWARIEQLDGDNGYHHFILMSQAAQENDDDGFERHALKMLDSSHFTPSAIPVFTSLYERYRQVPEVLWDHPELEYGPKGAAGVMAMALSAAIALPGYQQFVRACEDAGEERRRLCARVALHMAESSTLLIDRSIAIAVLKKVGSPAELERANTLERQSRWLQSSMARFDQDLDDSETGEYFDLFASEGEFSALRYAARVMGRPVEPPADWQP